MGIMDKIFGGKTAATITSAALRSEINRAETEIASLQAKLSDATAGIALLDDEAHIEVEKNIAATRRAISRLDARVGYLTTELPAVVAAEEAAAKADADKALRDRAESARNANSKEAAKLLKDYDSCAAKLGDILARLAEIAAETNSTNKELHSNPAAESVTGYETLHRKHPDQQATERREMRDVWVHTDGTVTEATKDAAGSFIEPTRTFDRTFGYDPQPKLERREIVVGRIYFRPGHYESPLSAIILPAGFCGSASHWPRK